MSEEVRIREKYLNILQLNVWTLPSTIVITQLEVLGLLQLVF